MQLNQYSTYFLISQNENKKCNENTKILSIINTISEIKTMKEAKEFFKQNYKINDSIQHFSLCANSFLEIKETAKKYTLRISYTNNDEKECIIFSYKK
jgi:hypothetical protein